MAQDSKTAADVPALAASAGPCPETPAEKALAARLAELIFDTAPAGESAGLDDAARTRLTDLAFAVTHQRAPGVHRLFVGAGEGHPGSRRMPVVLNTDDMPFLVDSATAVITGAGLEIIRLFHPVMGMRRDADGMLLEAGMPDAPRESLIVMEVERAPARKRAAILQQLDHAYTDVRRAVGDWEAMLRMLRDAARGLNDRPPPIAPHLLAESIAFIEWLAADKFTLLGATDGKTGLGVLRDPPRFRLPPDRSANGTEAMLLSKTALRSSVHRPVPIDLLTVRRFDSDGRAVGAWRFLGLFTSAALRENPARVPLVRRKVAEVTERLGYEPRSHAGRALTHVLESFPREELFLIGTEELLTITQGLLALLDRPRPAVFVRHDAKAGTASVLIYTPRDLYSAALRSRMAALIEEDGGGRIAKFDVELRAQGLARVHYMVESARRAPDAAALEAGLLELTRGWDDALEAALVELVGPARAARLRLTYGSSFGPAYRAEFTAAEAATDIVRLSALATPDDRHVSLYRRDDDQAAMVRMKIYRLGEVIALSDSVPMLENFGFRVIDEMAHDLAGGKLGWVHDFRLQLPTPPDGGLPAERIEQALAATMTGAQENDLFNALITSNGLLAEEANWFRAWFRYLRQTGLSYGITTAVEAARRNPQAAARLVALFRALHDPQAPRDAETDARAALAAALNRVEAIDDDRILRLFAALVEATLRTNAFVPGGPPALALKLDSALVPDLPKPVPWREIWVYSPRVEGIHLRGGPIARGGLRWSDRRDDFRTEVLGLVKAQMVKNAVIVPTGAKGGFYPKQLPDPAADRDAWAAEGRAAYQLFIRTLLSITDNRDQEGRIVPPAHLVRRDGDDPYLVVAADKGTASFSDTANAIAEETGFWLGDAFASGGSAGYDHKAMGITARGAFVSVTRHFAELGVDVQAEPISVAGVGDMSGDVFGNGMLLSKALKLVAAFDHRHIFLDPNPDPAVSWEERARLFALPRSSWADYNAALISTGGGVFPRTQKAIALSPEVRALLAVDADEMAPSELLAAILQAPVDLLWFGGIGTYVKAQSESQADAGDRANDAHRVNGEDLRARVVGEGANLGVTQAGRIACALAGGRINTDFIDNSAGVDTSDHEVNIKIALGMAERQGKLSRSARDALLHRMTDEVAALVLADNSAQTLALSVAEARGVGGLDGQIRLLEMLEAGGRLDRVVEGLPDARTLADRRRNGHGLTRPELAVLLAYAKMDLKAALVDSDVVEDALLEPDLIAAFPAAMQESMAAAIASHPLRREIIATRLANLLVNRGGMTLAHGLSAELGCPLTTIAAAFVSARTLFDLHSLWRTIDAAAVPAQTALKLHGEAANITRTLVSEIARRRDAATPAQLAARLAPGLQRLLPQLDMLLRPEPRAQVEAIRQRLAAEGSPTAVTDWIGTLNALTGSVGVVALASDLGIDEARTAEAYTRLGEVAGLDWAKGAVADLAPADGWERLLAATTARHLEVMRFDLIGRITPPGGDPLNAVEQWLDQQRNRVESLAAAVQRARHSGQPTLAMIAHLAGIAQATLSA